MTWIAYSALGAVLVVLVSLGLAAEVLADDKATNPDKQANQACQEQLLTAKVKAQNLDEQRDRVTQEKSQVQIQLYRAQQEVQALKKQLDEATKK